MIEMGKQYRTRDGREVRIYAIGCGGNYPVHGAHLESGKWELSKWTADGSFVCELGSNPETTIDLIEVKPRIKRTVWLNVYPAASLGSTCHATRRSADGRAASDRIACISIEIDCEEGEGL